MTTASLARPTGALLRLLRGAIAWWIGELAEMAPRRLLHLIGRPAEPTSVLHLGADALVLSLADRRGASPITVPLTGYDDEERRARVRAAMRSRRGEEAVLVRLDRDLVFETGVELPLSAEPSLNAILQHQIERLVPLAAAETCFAYRIAARAPLAKTLRVDLTVAKKATVDAALAAARAVGLSPQRVVASVPGDGAQEREIGSPLTLWQARGTTESDRQYRLRRGLELVVLVLLLTAYGLYIHRLDRVRDRLETRIAAAEPAASAVRGLAQRLGKADAAAAFVRRLQGRASPLEVLDALTRLVPEDSWLTRLTVRGRTVEVVGFSPRASDLIARVERSAIFANPRFRSPITLAADGKSQRFDLAFEIKPEPAR